MEDPLDERLELSGEVEGGEEGMRGQESEEEGGC